MVEVVTLEEFVELGKTIEERLDAIEKRLDDLVKDLNEKNARARADVEGAMRDLNSRFDDLEESSKGFVDRLRDAILPRSAEPQPSRTDSNPVGGTEKTLGKVADVIMRCPNFFEWDWCQDNCPMYLLCDDIAATQDVSKLSKKDTLERIKGIFKRLEALRSRPRAESPDIAV